MKPLLSLLCAAALSVPTIASAALINITNDLGSPAVALTDYDKGLLGGLGQQDVFDWLGATVAKYNADLNAGPDLPAPTGGGVGGFNALVEEDGTTSVDLTLYSYAVLHYGKGPGGVGDGGGIVAFYLNGTPGDFTFPQTGAGPNGNGGVSFVRLYGPTAVPEGGATFILLGAALCGIGAVRRFLKI